MIADRFEKALIALAVAFTLLFCLGPIVYMILGALSRSPDFLLPEKSFGLTLSHFWAVTTSESLHFLSYLRNSLIISIASAVISVFCASLAAYAVTRMPWPGNRIVVLCGSRLRLPQGKMNSSGRKPGCGEVLLGVRPEHIVLTAGPDRQTLSARVKAIEPLGRELLLHLDSDGCHLAALSAAKHYRTGQKIDIAFDEDHIHLFISPA